MIKKRKDGTGVKHYKTENSARKSIEGFSAVEAIVVVLVVVLLGLGGWYVWHKNQKSEVKTTQNSHMQTDKSQAQPEKQNEQVADPSEGGKYLVIKEWGVRFPVPEDLQESLYYTADANRVDTMVIDSKEFPTGAECVSFALARTTSQANNPTDPNGFTSSSFTKLGNFYFSRAVGIIACSNDQNVEQRAAKVQKELYDAAASLELTN